MLTLDVTSSGGGFVSDSGCSLVRPILPSEEDQMTRGTEVQILSHNEIWERICSEE